MAPEETDKPEAIDPGRPPSKREGLGRRGERAVYLSTCKFTPSVFPAKNPEKNAKRRAKRDRK